MADQRLTQLPALTTPAAEDLLYIVDDPSGTPTSKAVRADALLALGGGASGPLGSAAYTFVTTSGARTLNPALPTGTRGLWWFAQGLANLGTAATGPAVLNGSDLTGGIVIHDATTDSTRLAADLSLLIPPTAVTLMIAYRWRDTTWRNAGSIGANYLATDPARADAHYWTDSTLYWMFGGQQLNIFPQTKDTTWHVWAYTAGPRGMEIWKDGTTPVATNALTTTRAATTAPYSLGTALGSGSDLAEYQWAFVHETQLSQAQIAAIIANPQNQLTVGAPLPCTPGEVQFSTGYPYTGVTYVVVHRVDGDGIDQQRAHLLRQPGEILRVESVADPTKFATFQLTAVPSVPLASLDEVRFAVTQTGDSGAALPVGAARVYFGAASGADDVLWTGPDAPTDPAIELWADTDAPALPSSGGGGGWPLVTLQPFSTAGWTWINQGPVTVTESARSVWMSTPNVGGSTNWRVLHKALPAGTPTITIGFQPQHKLLPTATYGLALVESGTGKMVMCYIAIAGSGPSLEGARAPNATGYDSTFGASALRVPHPDVMFLRVQLTATQYTFTYSADGEHFLDIHTENKTAYFTTGPDRVGLQTFNTSTDPSYCAFLHWSET